MPIRRGRPGLIGTMARTAVVAGTATATVNAVSNHSAKKQQAAEQQQAAYDQQQQAQQAAYQQGQQAAAAAFAAPAPAAAAPAAGGFSEEALAQLKQLGDLKAAGVLTDEEFAAAKAKILGI